MHPHARSPVDSVQQRSAKVALLACKQVENCAEKVDDCSALGRIPEMSGRNAEFFREYPAEILRVLEADRVGYLGDVEGGIRQ